MFHYDVPSVCLGVPAVPAAAVPEGSVADPNPDPPDPQIFLGLPDPDPLPKLEVWIRIRILLWIRILLSSCKNSKKNLDSYHFGTLFDFLSLKNDVM